VDIDLTGSLEHIVTVIKDAMPEGRKNVTSDATQLRLPGVLVQFAGMDLDTLAGYSVSARVLVITGDDKDADVIKAWEQLVGHVLDADVEVTGPITTAGVDLPQHDQPLPALAIPVRVHQE
jgi:hypothetical protein